MMKLFSKIKVLLVSVAVALPLFSCATVIGDIYRSLYRVTNEFTPYDSIQDFDCQIVSTTSPQKALSLTNTQYDIGDAQSSKPQFTMVNNSGEYADLKTRFTIKTLYGGITYGNYNPYYITSPGDPNSRIDCKNANFSAGELWFFKEKTSEPTKTNACQTFYIETRDTSNGREYRFFLVSGNTRYYLTFTTGNAVKLINQSSINTWSLATFYVLPLAGNYTLSSHTMIVNNGTWAFDLNSTTGYYRTLTNRKSNKDYALFGHPFSFGINTLEEYSPETLKGLPYFKLPYNSAGLNFVYDFTYTSLWQANNSLHWAHGLETNAQESTSQNWVLQSATNDINDCIDGRSIGTGMIGLMVEDADNHWTYVSGTSFNYIDRSYHGNMSFDLKSFATTQVQRFRIFFAYRIALTTTSTTHYDVFLQSDSFYLSIYGQSYTDEFLPNRVTPLEDETPEEETGYSVDVNGSLPSAVLKGSLLSNGFTVTPSFYGYQTTVERYLPNTYTTGDYLVRDTLVTYGTGATNFNDNGRYHIISADKFNDIPTNEGDIYVAGSFKEFFFGEIFGVSSASYNPDNPIFVNGERIIAGQAPDEYKELGVSFPYANYVYPTYNGEVSLRARPTLSYASKLKITFERLDEYGDVVESNVYNNNYFSTDRNYDDDGTYHIKIETTFNSQCGYNPTFEIRFHIVHDNQKPFLNSALLNAYRGLINYIPDFYTYTGKTVEADYEDNGTVKSTSRELRYIFHSYDDALSYGLGNEKSKVEELSGGTYSYNGKTYNDEYSLFSALYKNAKLAIRKDYINYSITGGLDRIQDLSWKYVSSGHVVPKNSDHYDNLEEVPDYYLTILESALSKATDKQFANGFRFMKDSNGIASDHISVNRVELNEQGQVISRTQVIADYDYSLTIGQALNPIGVSGTYEFVETNIHGYTTRYYKDYLVSNSKCNAIITFDDGSTIDSTHVEKTVSRGAVIDNINNPHDNYSLVIITDPDNRKIITNTHDFARMILSKAGHYYIYIRDRAQNTYKADVEVI